MHIYVKVFFFFNICVTKINGPKFYVLDFWVSMLKRLRNAVTGHSMEYVSCTQSSGPFIDAASELAATMHLSADYFV